MHLRAMANSLESCVADLAHSDKVHTKSATLIIGRIVMEDAFLLLGLMTAVTIIVALVDEVT